MPYKPKLRDTFPEWIYDISGNDEDLIEVLIEAFVARYRAARAFDERNGVIPKLCEKEYEVAERILEAIHDGTTKRADRLQRAAVALRKFTAAHQSARFLETDESPRYARDPKAKRAPARGKR
jgi:hypothetical protein